jgi:S1-C subfamily serine protease
MRYLIVIVVLFVFGSYCYGQDTVKQEAKPTPQSNFNDYQNNEQNTEELQILDQQAAKKVEEARKEQAVKQRLHIEAVYVKPLPALHPEIIVLNQLPGLPVKDRVTGGPSQYDSRIDVRALDPSQPWTKGILRNSLSVAVVVSKTKLRKISPGFYQIDDSSTLGSTYQLCPGEAFKDQPVLGTGTAIVTGKRQLLTAAHVFAAPVDQYAVIFGFEILNKKGAYKRIIPADSVYFPVNIVRQSQNLDIAVFTVDRDMNTQPLKWSVQENLPVGEEIYMIGFPYGLPMKVAANASIVSNSDVFDFYAALDAFAGNSGSPVFDLKTNQVIGILVSGGVDFQWNGTCNTSTICSIPFCPGEKAIRITSIKNLLFNGN